MSEDFREFWRDDFTCLKHAGRLIMEAMRRDEETLEDRIHTGHNPSSHLYFSADGDENAALQYQRHIPLPTFIQNARSTTRRNFQMGLWTKAELAWAIVDATVYIWKFLDANAPPFVFDTTNKQYVIAVGLVRPKTDVFVENVEWCLVVTTIECVYLSALYRENENNENNVMGSSSSSSGRLLLVDNVFKVSSDGAHLTVVAGSKDGRIFLGGTKGELYAIDYFDGPRHTEMDVSDKLAQFYDGTLEVGPVVSSETSIMSEIGKRLRDRLSNTSERKCIKLEFGNVNNGFSFDYSFWNYKGDGVDRILVDDDRNFLFALTQNGYLILRSMSDPTACVSKMNVEAAATEYLRRMGRRDAMGGSYQTNSAAVGGQDMARTIAQNSRWLLKPVTMQLITRNESQTFCLVIVTRGGLRLYFSMGLQSLVLGHIRGAQPLLNNQNRIGDFALDVSGGYRPSISLDSAVNAAHYYKGLLVTAFANTVDVESIIAVSGPDSQLRTLKQSGRDILQVPDGITESIAYPLGEAKLAGGIIYDIGEVEEKTKKSQILLRFSASPTDQELRRPFLPPPYSLSSSTSKTSGESSIVQYKKLPGFEFLQEVAKRVILRSLRSPIPRSEDKGYRISRRLALQGFSSTAAEKRNGIRSTPNQSFRLKSWLLRPKPLALQYMAAQYPPEKCHVVLLNAGGFHVFARTSPLEQFALSISGNGGGVSFFDRFRRQECCAMGLALAIGLLPASAHLQKQAEQVVLQQGKAPYLRLRSGQTENTSSVSATTNADDSLIPPSYEFFSSPLCEGLIFLVSRLLRPIWHKPLVVVTEGPVVKQPGSASFTSPAKVEFLLDDLAASEILLPLSRLAELVSRIFINAIVNIPGVTNPNIDRMEIDADRNESILIPFGEGVAEAVDPVRMSRKLEERNIHSLYRTISRSCQLLNLFSILQRQTKLGGVNKTIQWGLLHGITFSEFVESAEGQDRLEGLLNNLVASTLGRSNQFSAQQMNSLSSSLSSHCYYFFSAGSQSACSGHQFANRALSIQRGTTEFFDLRQRAADCFLKASRHWHNPALITGRTLSVNRSESHRDLAQAAERNGSPLALAANVLVQLDDVVNAANICLETAANFQPRNTRESFRYIHERRGTEMGFDWEKSLYHKRKATSEVLMLSTSPRQSPVQIEVAYKDAINTCYALIFNFLDRLMGNQRELAERMLSFCSSSTDQVFLGKLFEFLLDGYKELLLSICSPDLENWLKTRQDEHLLWRYLNVHLKHNEAGQVALGIAYDSSSDMRLASRIEWLDRAVVSFGEMTRTNTATRQRIEAIESRNLAYVQERIVKALQSHRLSEDESKTLASSLLSPTDLYNNYAAKYGLAEECLRIHYVCKQNNPEYIHRLWRLMIYGQLLPTSTRNRSIYDYLTAEASEFQLENLIELVVGNEQSSNEMFEDCGWEDRLRTKTASLAKDFYESTDSFVLPVQYLAEKLEELRRLVKQLSPGWSLKFLLDVGVPALDVLEAFESVTQRMNDPDGLMLRSDSEAEHYLGVLEFIEYALLNRKPMEKDRLVLKLDSLKTRIGNMARALEFQDRLESIYREIRSSMFNAM